MTSDSAHQSGETRQGKTGTNSRRRADGLRQSLEREIFSRILLPGERLDESGLARRFGVSHTPVREAMRAHVAIQGEVFTDLVSMLPPHYLQATAS